MPLLPRCPQGEDEAAPGASGMSLLILTAAAPRVTLPTSLYRWVWVWVWVWMWVWVWVSVLGRHEALLQCSSSLPARVYFARRAPVNRSNGLAVSARSAQLLHILE